MARIRIAATDPASIPTPPANKATMFLDQTDMSFKAKLPDGTLIPISATEEYIQDQFANFIQDSSTINFTYDDGNDTAYLEVIQSALDVFQIPVTPTGNLTSNNVGDALNELQSSIDSTDANFASHTDGGPSKHDATEIDYERADGSRNSIQAASDNVEAALSDLDDNKLARNGSQPMTGNLNMANHNIVTSGLVDGRDVSVDGTKLDTIETGATADQLASEVPVTPVGNLGSTNVQSALQELQGDIDTLNSTFEERAQDAVGNILQDTSTVEFTYDDAGNQISAIVPDAGITDQKVATGINAQKIGDGSVENAEYQRLNGVTAPIQTQIDSKVAKAGDTMTGPLVLSADPLTDFQAATKRYVDNAIQGLNSKDAAKAATTGPGTLATSFENGDTLDGVTLVTGDRILIKNQTNQAENGIYIVQASGAPIRSNDADVFSELISAFVFIEQGTSQANTGWTSQAQAGGTINVDPVPWVQFSSAGVVTTDGQGIERVGNELRLELDGPTLSKSGTGLKVADAQIGTTQLTDQGVTNGKVADNTLTDQKISPTAAIQHSKMAALTANRALASNASGVVVPSVVTATEQNQLQGVTSNIQTQLDNKTPISHLDGGASKHDATEIDYERVDGSKTSIQAASDDVESALSDLDDNKLARNGSQAMTGNLNMGANNIVTSGLVDGRDVSVDGTKLDGIEPGATADQVASEVPVTPVGNIASTDVQSALAELDSEKQPIDGDLTAVAALSGTGLVTRTATDTMTTRSIVAAAGETTVSNGNGVSGNPTIGLPDVGPGAGTVGATNSTLSITTDIKGRVTARSASLISILSSQVTDFAATVRSTLLTGYIVGTSAALAATDTILQAFGKVQAQLNTLFARNINAGSGLTGGGDLTADRTISMPNVGTANTYGSATQVPVLTTDAQGRVSAVTPTTITGVPGANITNTPAGNIAATNVQAAINELDAEKQPLDGDLTAIAALSGTGIITRTAANTMAVRTISAAAGETTVSNGDGISGNPTIGLPDVGPGAGSVGATNSSLSLTTDAKGRVTARSASLISIVASQVSNFASTVLSTVLTGYAVGTSAALTATDTILEAFGKVQAQLNTLFARNINTGTGLQGGGNLTADRTLSLTNTGVVAGTYGDGLNVAQPTVDAQGRITAIVNVPITFGQDYQRFVDTVQSTSTSTANPVTAVASSFTTTSLPAGTYRVNLQFAWTHSVNTSDARFALYVDGVLVGSQMNVELSDVTTNWVSQLLGGVTFGSAGTHTIELRFGSESGANTVTVNRVEADIWRVV